MKTFLTNSPFEAAKFIKKSGIVSFPTETVYGLGANIFDEKAIEKIFVAKKRPADNPLIAHVGDIQQIESVVAKISDTAQKLIEAFFPAPLTLVLPKAKNIPMIATAGLETIGVRMPKNDLALEFLRECKMPLVAPSANLSGKPSPTTWEAVYEDLNGRIDCILQGETTKIGLESTVLDCTSETPLILRAGAITLEQLRKVVPETQNYYPKTEEKPRSPGLKHRHYSPKAKVMLVDSTFKFEDSQNSAFIGLNSPNTEFKLIKLCSSIEEYAHHLFNFFRKCDKQNIEKIYCEKVDKQGLGLALIDRITRASNG